MSAREYLEKAGHYQVKPEELFHYFAIHVLNLTVLYQKSHAGKKPILARSNRPGSKYVVAFTDQEAASIVRVRQPEYLEMTEEPALPYLLKAYRSNAEGLMFNPGLASRFFVVRHQLLEWIRQYSIHKFSKVASVWVVRKGNSILKGSYQQGFSTIVVYTGEHEANKSAEKSGGVATPIPWDDIFRYLERLGTSTLYVNYGLPEAFLLNAEHVQVIRHGSRNGFEDETAHTILIPNAETNQKETATTLITQQTKQVVPNESPVEEKKAEVGDWESAFSEEEPLTIRKDIQHTGSFKDEIPPVVKKEPTIPAQILTVETVEQVDEKPPTTPAPEMEKQEVAELENHIVEAHVDSNAIKEDVTLPEKTLMEEQESVAKSTNSKTSSVSQKTFSAFDNPWDDDDDGFGETIPKGSLFFQSNNNSVSEKVEQPEVQKVKDSTPVEQPVSKPISSSGHVKPPIQEPVKEPVPKPKEPKSKVIPSTIPEDIAQGLRVLEKATDDGQGMANGWEVCRSLADLRRIWVIVDMEGKMVILASQENNQIADFFTSETYAQTLIDEAHCRNSNLPPMVPKLISTKKLFRALAPTQCIIWINRGSPNAWTSIMGDTLPYVLQLMAQKE